MHMGNASIVTPAGLAGKSGWQIEFFDPDDDDDASLGPGLAHYWLQCQALLLRLFCDGVHHSSALRTNMVRRYYTRKHGRTTVGLSRGLFVLGFIFFAWWLLLLGYLSHIHSSRGDSYTSRDFVRFA
ncbi:hypothetical protein P171DRAFT_160585 [Karstenula rhodostoma CBS 690.94]|uniref:Uncharacterized protein n=1 Tax=Karstenula rhodostoma CBS 690.94 TaxID=1392251 RepID=A0A9P4U5U1_9PLEO|nr:hypothetical protein P171DRAFT_160585 [Karstenula rhodostoma CBS 690.94]